MATYILNVDPYDHNIVIHSFPAQQKQLYTKLLGPQSVLTGTSLQNSWRGVHQQTLYWLQASRAAGKPWVVANDEQNPASMGVPPDPGYKGFDGWANDREGKFNLDDIRKKTLWGNLMAGGAGVEYYFGYRLAENDLLAEDFRSRDRSWDYAGIAVTFFQSSQLPFHRMSNQNQLVKVTHRAGQQSSHAKQTTPWVLTDLDQHYLVYFDRVTASTLDMSGSKGQFSVRWFNPRTCQYFDNGSVISVAASSEVNIGLPPLELQQDWLAIIRQSI